MIEQTLVLGPHGERQFKISRVSPSVYLDTCGLRKISDDPVIRDRFVAAIRSSGGTLVLSTLGVAELTGQSHLAPPVGRLVDMLAPHLYFQQASFLKVVAAEKRLHQSGHRLVDPPDIDDTVLTHLIALTQMTGGQITYSAMFHMNELLQELYPKIQSYGLRRLEWLESFYNNNEQKAKRHFLYKPERDQPVFATMDLIRAFARSYMGSKPSTPLWNDGIDLEHSTVPSAYCDFVVLDKKWKSRVNEAAKSMRKGGLKAPVARGFGNSPDELKALVDSIEIYTLTKEKFWQEWAIQHHFSSVRS